MRMDFRRRRRLVDDNDADVDAGDADAGPAPRLALAEAPQSTLRAGGQQRRGEPMICSYNFDFLPELLFFIASSLFISATNTSFSEIVENNTFDKNSSRI